MILHHQLHYNLQVVIQYLAVYGYAFVFLGTIFEGELVLLAAGFLSYLGLMNFWLVLGTGFLGATIGDNMWFWIGKKGGTPLIYKYGKLFLLTKRRLNRARQYFDTHGTKTIFFSRFIAGTRISSAVLAGALGMPSGKFIKSNVAGAGIWAIVTTILGFLFGSSFDLLTKQLRKTEFALLILALGVIIILILHYLLSRKDNL